MKKTILFTAALLALVSCGSGPSREEQKAETVRLERELAEKDSLLNDVFASFNEIAENLIRIKDREGIVTANISGEISKEKRAQINEDVAAINELLVQNRASLERLKGTTEELRRANIQLGELETLVANFAKQIQDKDADILMLRDELLAVRVQVDELNTVVDSLQTGTALLADDRQSLESKLNVQDDMLHTVYYIVGRERDLRDAGIVDKSGVIGRTLTMNSDFNTDHFTRTDLRELNEIVVGQRRATLVTSHPADSYQLVVGENNLLEKIKITDPGRFWESSKVLVVSYR